MKIDMHVHTSEISGCAHLTSEETIRMYAEAGYDAIVITNHYTSDYKNRFAKRGLDLMDEYKACYEKAKAYGEKYGVKIFCGYELRLDQNENDYLIYGMSFEDAREYDKIFAMTTREFSEFAKERGILFYQAHPFRNRMTVVYPPHLFGIEVKNGNPRHDSRNEIAESWAERFGLHKIAGSDCHESEDVGISGIETDEEVNSIEELVEVLKKDAYRII